MGLIFTGTLRTFNLSCSFLDRWIVWSNRSKTPHLCNEFCKWSWGPFSSSEYNGYFFSWGWGIFISSVSSCFMSEWCLIWYCPSNGEWCCTEDGACKIFWSYGCYIWPRISYMTTCWLIFIAHFWSYMYPDCYYWISSPQSPCNLLCTSRNTPSPTVRTYRCAE